MFGRRSNSEVFAILALIVVVIAVSSLCVRAVQNERGAVLREIEARSEKLTQSLPGALEPLLRKSEILTCPVGERVSLSPLSAKQMKDEESRECFDEAAKLSESGTVSLDFPTRCPRAKSASGRFLVPMLYADRRDADGLGSWILSNGGVLDLAERRMMHAMIEYSFAEPDERARLQGAVASNAPIALRSIDSALADLVGEHQARSRDEVVLRGREAWAFANAKREVYVMWRATLERCGSSAIPLPTGWRLLVSDSKRPGSVELASQLHVGVSPTASERMHAVSRGNTILVGFAIVTVALTSLFGLVVLRRWQEAKKLSELRVDFVAAVSHELRTPLASVRMLSDLLEGQSLSKDDTQAAVHAISLETKRLSTTVDRMLTLRRMSSGRLESKRASHDLRAVLQKIAAESKERHDKDIALESGDPCEWSFDEDLLSMAISVLLDNAAKYGSPPIRIVVTRTDAELQIRVTDNGPGVPTRDRKRIFQPFERGQSRLSEAIEGTGIGLALVAQIAKAHHGHAYVTGERGNTFVITLGRES